MDKEKYPADGRKERFLDFAEAFRGTLEQKGFKLDKWKR